MGVLKDCNSDKEPKMGGGDMKQTRTRKKHMQRIVTTFLCVTVLAFVGCGWYKEKRARQRAKLKARPTPRVQVGSPSKWNFHGLDLTTAPRTTRSSDLPDVWEERPKGSHSFEIRKDVECSYSGLDGAVYYIRDKNCFYIQHDPPGSSTMTFYGPFQGNPKTILKLGMTNTAEPGIPADADKPRR